MFIPTNTKYFYKGMSLRKWCEENGMSYDSVAQRIHKYPKKYNREDGCERAIQDTIKYNNSVDFKHRIINAGGDVSNYQQIYKRVYYYGWDFERAIKEPIDKRYWRKNGTGQIQNETIEH